jgi:cation transport ATPase
VNDTASQPDRNSVVWSLILANVVTIVVALSFSWPLMTLLLPYWLQSGIIGYYSQKRIRMLHDFIDIDGVPIHGDKQQQSQKIKRSAANLFIAYYFCLFHLSVLAGLISRGVTELPWSDWIGVIVATVAFAINHRSSFRKNAHADVSGRPKLGTLMLLPFARVVPMQVVIVVAVGLHFKGAFPVVLFGLVKTVIDVAMHVVEHRVLRKPTR